MRPRYPTPAAFIVGLLAVPAVGAAASSAAAPAARYAASLQQQGG